MSSDVPATVCVRLDGLADQIARGMYERFGGSWDEAQVADQAIFVEDAVTIVALLQSLAVQ